MTMPVIGSCTLRSNQTKLPVNVLKDCELIIAMYSTSLVSSRNICGQEQKSIVMTSPINDDGLLCILRRLQSLTS